MSDKYTSLQKRYSIEKVLIQNPNKAKKSEEFISAFDMIYFSEETSDGDDNLYEAESIRVAYELMKQLLGEVLYLFNLLIYLV